MLRIRKIDLFRLGLLLIPFDNLIIAPSRGWAAVSPIIFFIYLVINRRILCTVISKGRKELFIITFLLMYQSVLILINGMHLKSMMDGVMTLFLGMCFYLSLVVRYIYCKKDINVDGEVLYIGYLFGLVYGIVRYLAMTVIPPLLGIFSLIEKRHYTRLAFSFTEPSFTSMHIFGVLFLFSTMLTKKDLIEKYLRLGLLYLVISVATKNSARCIVDIGFFVLLLIIHSIVINSRQILRGFSILLLGVVSAPILLEKVPRIQRIIDKGVYADPSMASRWFRVDAALGGFSGDLVKTFFGWGLGNLVIPLKNGFDQAFLNYSSQYMKDINSLRNSKDIDSLFCLPIKLMAEWGLLLALLFILVLAIRVKKQKLDVFVFIMSLWLYVQFDSYAFYTLWMLMYIIKYNIQSNSYFTSVEDMISVRRNHLTYSFQENVLIGENH